MQRTSHFARAVVARSRPAFGFLVGFGALIVLTLTQAAVLDAMAGHVTGLVVLLLIVAATVRALRPRD